MPAFVQPLFSLATFQCTMVQELPLSMLPFPLESQIVWCICNSTCFYMIQDREGGTLHQWRWTINPAELSACFSCTCEPTQYTERFCQGWPCTRSNSQRPSNLRSILNCSHNQVHLLIHVLLRRRRQFVLENTMCRRREQHQDTTKLPLIAIPKNLIALFLSHLIVSKTSFRVKFHHASMATSATLASIHSLSSRWCDILMTYTPLTSGTLMDNVRRSVIPCSRHVFCTS